MIILLNTGPLAVIMDHLYVKGKKRLENRISVYHGNMYQLASGKDPIERAKYLQKKEWQRWVPLVNSCRMIRDLVTEDSRLTGDMYSTKYNVTNVLFTFGSSWAAAYGIIHYLLS